MKTFHCTNCDNLVFFENVQCLKCEHALAYLPHLGVVAALIQDPDGAWKAIIAGSAPQSVRLCANYSDWNICNWGVPPDDANPLCQACRLTRVIPNLSAPENRVAWFRLEVAKRRLVYSLVGLKLAIPTKVSDGDSGLAFQFLQDSPFGDAQRVLTGHDNGLVTVNIAEADDVLREQQRTRQNEPYRTLLGHFRHEVGHYYWDRLIQGGPFLEAFRAKFGDERADYQAALNKHYQNGPPPQWERDFISAYASCHPWEDWAESWAHFLHMTDALETGRAAGIMLKPKTPSDPTLGTPPPDPLKPDADFDGMIDSWMSLTYVLNNLNRGLGLADSYPFVLGARVIEKLRFVHEVAKASGSKQAPAGRA